MQHHGLEGKGRRNTPASSSTPIAGRRLPHPPLFRYLVLGFFLLATCLMLIAAESGTPLAGAVELAEDSPVEEEFAFVAGPGIPLDVNDRVDRWVHRYLVEDRASFETFLEREGLYGKMIRDRLRRRGLPMELFYIPMIESGFDPDAVSAGNAVGMWQFMEATARAYGLEVNEEVDERRDPVLATEAALDYLEDLHETFGSWPLAVAAYNAGPETIRAAVAQVDRKERGWKDDLFWKIRADLPLQAREYLPKLLAVALISQHAEHFGFVDVEPAPAEDLLRGGN